MRRDTVGTRKKTALNQVLMSDRARNRLYWPWHLTLRSLTGNLVYRSSASYAKYRVKGQLVQTLQWTQTGVGQADTTDRTMRSPLTRSVVINGNDCVTMSYRPVRGIPLKKTYNPPQKSGCQTVCSESFFRPEQWIIQTYHGNILLMDNKHRKLFVV